MLWLLRLITGHEAWIWFEQSESFTQIQFQAEALIGFHPLDLTLAFQNDNPCKTHLRVRFTSVLHRNAFEGSPAPAAHAKILFLYYSIVSTYSIFALCLFENAFLVVLRKYVLQVRPKLADWSTRRQVWGIHILFSMFLVHQTISYVSHICNSKATTYYLRGLNTKL